jgi:hypothetical protein
VGNILLLGSIPATSKKVSRTDTIIIASITPGRAQSAGFRHAGYIVPIPGTGATEDQLRQLLRRAELTMKVVNRLL